MTNNVVEHPHPFRATASRRHFITMAGAALAAAACSSDGSRGSDAATSTSRAAESDQTRLRVAIVGAGAAGLTAAHLLTRRDVDVTIFEATPTHGGRLATARDLVDFPLPLGAEWLIAPAETLALIADDPNFRAAPELRRYAPDSPTGYYDADQLTIAPLGDFDYLNFVEGSWADFFDTHIVPSAAEHLRLSTEIVAIDASGSDVRLREASGDEHEVDRVIVTVPISVLQRDQLSFVPPLPERKRAALADAVVWDGIKVFIEFDEAFYPTFLEFADSDTATGQRSYYDAAALRDTTANVLGLFAVGSAAEPYLGLADDALRDHILAELDEVFDGAASRSYLRHVAKNWRDAEFIGQAYLNDYADESIPSVLAEPIDGRIYFAGDGYTSHGDWGGVDDAARSALDAVNAITGTR